MKFTLILLGLVSFVSISKAGQLPGRDNLSGLVAGSGIYSRSMVTDVEDGNRSVFCEAIVKVEVAVNVEQKNISYILTTVGQNGQLSESSEIIKVGRESLMSYETFNGIRVYSANGVKGNTITKYERNDAPWLGVKGKWENYGAVISFVDGKVKIGHCTYRRVAQ